MGGPSGQIRKASVAGLFYLSDPDELTRQVSGFLDGAEAAVPRGDVVGLIAPHAGFVYSGQVAAEAYAAVRGRSFDRVVILAPSHRAAFDGASIWPSGVFETPLGAVQVDEDASRLLLKEGAGFVRDLPGAHGAEHALEVQLPFLQVALPPHRIVPLVLGSRDLAFARRLGTLLADLFGTDDTLYIASSDLSHFHPYETAVRIDRLFLDLLERSDLEGLERAVELGNAEACGTGPVLTVAAAAKEHFHARPSLLRYANSGDTAGGREEVVGYASVLYTREVES